MIDRETRQQIIALVKREVVPAIGCTEPMCVALCTARATELLGCRPAHITALLSANILKNAMGVGIPGTGMVGLPIAIALGAIIGKSEYQLEVLKDLTPEALEQGKQFINEQRIDIQLKQGISEKLYVEVIAEANGKRQTAIIVGSHTHFLSKGERGRSSQQQSDGDAPSEREEDGVNLSFRLVYDFATTAPLDEIRFIEATRTYNMNAAREALKGNYGHNLGKTIDRPLSKGIFGNSIFCHIISRTASACDARMGGAMIPVMSNSGSGNQGICATNPVCVYAKENENTEEELIRALMLSHLTAIYIKQSLGTLSALCGCVVASIGSSVGITYLMGGDYSHHQRRQHRRALGTAVDGGQVRQLAGGHRRRLRRQEHPQPHRHWGQRHGTHRRDGAAHHDVEGLLRQFIADKAWPIKKKCLPLQFKRK